MSISETGGVISNNGAAEGSSVNDDQGVVSGEPVKRKRGRPRKYKPVSDASPHGELMKRKRGRPRKNKPVSDTSPGGEPVKRKRDRPPGSRSKTEKPKKMFRGRPPGYRKKATTPLSPSGSGGSAGEVPLKGLKKQKRLKVLSNWVCASDEDREKAHDRALELQSGLDPDNPSFVKPMLQSHVSGEFWLDLPVEFCETHMPERDETITLVNERCEVFLTKYLAVKTGFSAGWRGFAIEHELVDGDVLVFQMIEPTRFKVYIIRVN